jgi:pyruvate/2-oxoglutarate/acetoin dehydrogenase E1 component
LFLEYKAYYRVAPEKLPPELNLPVPDEDYIVPIGKARIVREGTDLSVVTYGSQVVRAIEAATRVAREDGFSVEVIDLRTIVPCDGEGVRTSVKKTNRALVTCEAPRTGSFGMTIVTEIIRTCFDDLDAPVERVTGANAPMPYAKNLEQAKTPSKEKIIAAIRRVCYA